MEVGDDNKNLRESWGDYSKGQNTLMQAYKFRLTIPNSLCSDYVTEKLMKCFQYGVIPIYLGSPYNSHDWDPGLAAGVHQAMIHVVDYDSMADLASFIVQVTRNHTKYMQFFEYLLVVRNALAFDISTSPTLLIGSQDCFRFKSTTFAF
eukprot:SAG31_NODE_5496_length_2501_cov_1.820566_2_plen_149_part_00